MPKITGPTYEQGNEGLMKYLAEQQAKAATEPKGGLGMTRVKIEFDVPADVDAAFRSGTQAAVIPLSHVSVAQLGQDVILSHEAMGVLADSLMNFLAGWEAMVQPDAELRAALEDIAGHLRGCGERLERTRELVGRAVFVNVYPEPRRTGGTAPDQSTETPEEGRRRSTEAARDGLMKYHLGIPPEGEVQ